MKCVLSARRGEKTGRDDRLAEASARQGGLCGPRVADDVSRARAVGELTGLPASELPGSGADAALGEIYPQGVTIAEQAEDTARRRFGGEQGDPGSLSVFWREPIGQHGHLESRLL